MKTFILSIIGSGLMLMGAIAYEASDANEREVQAAFGRWRQIAAEVVSNPTEDGVLKLGQGLRKLSLESIYPSEERFEVQAEVRRALQAIPKHADYFSKALERAIDAEFAEARDATSAVRVDPSRDLIYLTLAELPSPQVVHLLGNLLYDERDPWKDEPKSDYVRPFRNSVYAVDTLNRIGLEGVQIIEVKTTRDREAALSQWKLWYEQVKAGTRTFRFKGDPQEYSLAEPVSKAAEPSVSAPQTSGANETSKEAAGKPSK